MKIGVSLNIDVTKIDKARIVKGQKGKYLDATVFIDVDQVDQYGNHGMISQNVSKQEREQDVKGNILGNCKVFWKESSNKTDVQRQQEAIDHPAGSSHGQAPEHMQNSFDDSEDVPF